MDSTRENALIELRTSGGSWSKCNPWPWWQRRTHSWMDLGQYHFPPLYPTSPYCSAAREHFWAPGLGWGLRGCHPSSRSGYLDIQTLARLFCLCEHSEERYWPVDWHELACHSCQTARSSYASVVVSFKALFVNPGSFYTFSGASRKRLLTEPPVPGSCI